MKELIKIQSELKVAKSHVNKFGKYKYRKTEDVLLAVKPLAEKYNCTIVLTDDVQVIGEFLVLKSTATISNGTESISVSALAGIDDKQKGMALSQCFGSSSSYARKRALGGLLLIDDSEDADSTNTHGQSTAAPNVATSPSTPKTLSASAFQGSMKRYIGGETDIFKKAATKGYILTPAQMAEVKSFSDGV